MEHNLMTTTTSTTTPTVVVAETTNANTITVGAVSYDISKAHGAMDYMVAVSKDNSDLLPEALRLALDPVKGFVAMGWTVDMMLTALGDSFKSTAKKTAKELSKVDHAARFDSITVIKLSGIGKEQSIPDVKALIGVMIKAVNERMTAYNTINPDANLVPYSLSGGNVKSKVGGKGNGYSYDKLADMIKANAALWSTDNTMRIEFGARSLVYPILIENDNVMIQYTGPTVAEYTDTKTKKVKASMLVHGMVKPIALINQLNTQVNGSLVTDGKLTPSAGINTWLTCVFPGITIPDGAIDGGKTITSPTLEQFYNQYKAADDTATTDDTGTDEDGADDDGTNAPTE